MLWRQLRSQAEQLRKSTSKRTYRLRGEEVVFPHCGYSRTHLSAHVASASSTTPALDDQSKVGWNPDRSRSGQRETEGLADAPERSLLLTWQRQC